MLSCMKKKRFQYIGNCVQLDGDDVNEMKTTFTEITLGTFARNIGKDNWKMIQKKLGYDRSFPIKNDWHVGYFKAVYKNKLAYVLVWSGFEHVFIEI